MNLKINFFVTLFFIIILPFSVFAQSVKITAKKVTYTRPKPISDFKKTFTVKYPRVIAKSPQLAKKIENSISYKKVLFFSLRDEMGEFQWLEEADFQVGYNKKGILSIYLSTTGTTAHQTYNGKNVVVDLRTGKQVKSNDVFTNFDGLIAKIKEIQKEEIADFKNEIKKDNDYSTLDSDKLFEYVDFTKINLEDFSISDDGVNFQYSYGFPYVMHHIEPSGNYFLDWKSLKPFIKRDGLLRKFIR